MYAVNPIYKIILLIVCFVFSSNVAKATIIYGNYEGILAGIEVIGVDAEAAQKIRKQMPYQIGSKFALSDMAEYKAKCQQIIKNNLHASIGLCTSVLYNEKEFFLVIDVFPEDSRNKEVVFRKIPEKKQGEVAKLPKKLQELYNALDERRSLLISQGKFPVEIRNKGYVDYEDPILHDLALSLVEHAEKSNEILLQILHYSKNVEERRLAATLLSWSKHPENLNLILEWNVLLDPDTGVRNNVARSYISIMQNMKNEALLQKLIPIYCKQASLRTHTDRNKALISILEILQSDKNSSKNINTECESNIRYLSEMSILGNVGGTAKEIIKLIDETKNS